MDQDKTKMLLNQEEKWTKVYSKNNAIEFYIEFQKIFPNGLDRFTKVVIISKS